jgi:hypothetical protein
VALTLEDPRQRARALSDAAEALARAGIHARARELAAAAEESATDIDRPKPKEVADLAVTIAKAGDSLRGSRLLARALAMDDNQDRDLVP